MTGGHKVEVGLCPTVWGWTAPGELDPQLQPSPQRSRRGCGGMTGGTASSQQLSPLPPGPVPGPTAPGLGPSVHPRPRRALGAELEAKLVPGATSGSWWWEGAGTGGPGQGSPRGRDRVVVGGPE